MEVRGAPAVAARNPTLTPKAIIHQKYGSKACYTTEEVQGSSQNGCPGLVIPQHGPCMFRCTLQLPELSVTSDIFTRKKDAEQSAAKLALEKLGIQPATTNPTIQEAWDDMVARISYLFSNEFLSSTHPLSGHFRAAIQRVGDLYGAIPVSVLASYDAKLNSLCKSINPKVESDHFLVLSLVMRAARLSCSVVTSEEKLWIWRKNSFSPETIQALSNQQFSSIEGIRIKAIRIPCSIEKLVEPITLNVSSDEYYMDVMAGQLGVTDASEVLVSRTVGKTSSEMRLYYALKLPLHLSSSLEDSLKFKEAVKSSIFNARAYCLSGQHIYGDAILAAIGYTWKSSDLFYEDVSLNTYYRMLVGRLPDGGYKLSRDAIIVAELPIAYTTRSNWRGSSPRDLLCTFCRQHRLSEPVFSIISMDNSLDSPNGISEKFKSNVTNQTEEQTNANGESVDAFGREKVTLASTFRCEVRILSKNQDLIIEYLPKDFYRKQNDAIQNSALKVLSCLSKCFKQLYMSVARLSFEDSPSVCVHHENFLKEFELCPSVHSVQRTSVLRKCSLLTMNCMDRLDIKQEHFNIEGPDSGVFPSNGSLACISYVVYLVREGDHMKEILESSDEFEFEIGTAAVVPELEACVYQMSVNQSACFSTVVPHQDLIFAAAGNSVECLSLLSLGCFLEYSVTLLRVMEPLEDRIEQALFNPPLSKQRVEYALRYINESCATSLVDFGCGSGSLLDALLDHPTALEKIVGVDISKKSLIHAAKVLHSKLSSNSDPSKPSANIKFATLYDGSITAFDSRLYGFDIGTCLEVIEHMEEEQACIFGNIVLSSFCPRILIVSTPNYEYNSILQRTTLANREDDADEKTQSLPCRFRNHDHKFEWTREQFNSWALDLAMRHGYSVEFSGVGGSADVEPGFASQIAVFRRGPLHQVDESYRGRNVVHHYEVIWDWISNNL
ncbi:PREDICTED: small RNA 2'-O-methyltransferase isoform X2 [Nelumbo nucifera]|uniref:Small RNA 2'-O-methyltransferase n=2 Tax=Nelumbo nucifera TaxID=4432 RepID=A0A822YF71_NELNU|nr:PREDICTED: small RNA 2'-O-methyltransferase isoform X2 [Nelumbo nucifera]DAD29889.1 TPA_asm: hypothetical protein HUJ06_031357 [Nelumbo nucifera]